MLFQIHSDIKYTLLKYRSQYIFKFFLLFFCYLKIILQNSLFFNKKIYKTLIFYIILE